MNEWKVPEQYVEPNINFYKNCTCSKCNNKLIILSCENNCIVFDRCSKCKSKIYDMSINICSSK